MTMKEIVESDIEWVEVDFGPDASVTAQNLLAAAERLELDSSLVKTTTQGRFLVPAEVADEVEAYGDRDEDEVKDKSIDDFSKAELDGFAADNEIDLTGAKTSNATKAARIKEVLAQREADQKAEDGAAAAAAPAEATTNDDSAKAADESDKTQE